MRTEAEPLLISFPRFPATGNECVPVSAPMDAAQGRFARVLRFGALRSVSDFAQELEPWQAVCAASEMEDTTADARGSIQPGIHVAGVLPDFPGLPVAELQCLALDVELCQRLEAAGLHGLRVTWPNRLQAEGVTLGNVSARTMPGKRILTVRLRLEAPTHAPGDGTREGLSPRQVRLPGVRDNGFDLEEQVLEAMAGVHRMSPRFTARTGGALTRMWQGHRVQVLFSRNRQPIEGVVEGVTGSAHLLVRDSVGCVHSLEPSIVKEVIDGGDWATRRTGRVLSCGDRPATAGAMY